MIFAPAAFDWGEGFSASYEEITDPDYAAVNGRRTLDLVPVVTRDAHEINGVNYDIAAFELQGNPPPPFDTPKNMWAGGEIRGRIFWSYTAPANPDASFM